VGGGQHFRILGKARTEGLTRGFPWIDPLRGREAFGMLLQPLDTEQFRAQRPFENSKSAGF
jgi:hypothetical protein